MLKLHMDELARKSRRTKREFQDALNKLPEELDQTYQNTFERIASQHKDDFTLAQQVLSWVYHYNQKLNVRQLQNAIAIQNGEPELDSDSLLPPEYLISVCAGLVTCDSEKRNVHFVHYTAVDYFRRK
jgi:hypothetical protein